jgi:hypothetical protein
MCKHEHVRIRTARVTEGLIFQRISFESYVYCTSCQIRTMGESSSRPEDCVRMSTLAWNHAFSPHPEGYPQDSLGG